MCKTTGPYDYFNDKYRGKSCGQSPSPYAGLTVYCATLSLPARAQDAAVGIDPATKTVTIGAFTPTTGPVPFYAILTHAADAYFHHANDTGGIAGWKFKYVTYDDG